MALYGKSKDIDGGWWLTKDGEQKGLFEAESAVDEIISLMVDSDKRNIEQRIVGMEMVVERFSEPHCLSKPFSITSEQVYDICDEIFGGDSQYVRGKYS